MNNNLSQDKELSRNLWILIGICLLTAIISIVGGIYSYNNFIVSIDEYLQEFYDEMTGGIVPALISGTVYLSKYIIGLLLAVIPIAEFIISFILLIVSLLFQIGIRKNWKIITTNVLVVLMDIVKVLFILYLLFLIYLTYKVSSLLIIIFALQIIASLIPIVLSIKLIYVPSQKK